MDEPRQSRGWFRAMRSDDAIELIRANRNAFVLLYLIAYRARWSDSFDRHNLQRGQAFIGGKENIGLTEREYRTAKTQLQMWKFATFKATNKGTIATLMNTSVFSIFNDYNDEQNDNPKTDERQSSDKRATTNNKSKERKEGQEATPTLKTADRISHERELKAIGSELGKLGSVSDYEKGSKTYNRLIELTNRRSELRKILGVVA